jgi:hypothetical protein
MYLQASVSQAKKPSPTKAQEEAEVKALLEEYLGVEEDWSLEPRYKV